MLTVCSHCSKYVTLIDYVLFTKTIWDKYFYYLTPKKISDLPAITQLVSGIARPLTQIMWLCLPFMPHTFPCPPHQTEKSMWDMNMECQTFVKCSITIHFKNRTNMNWLNSVKSKERETAQIAKEVWINWNILLGTVLFRQVVNSPCKHSLTDLALC